MGPTDVIEQKVIHINKIFLEIICAILLDQMILKKLVKIILCILITTSDLI